MFKHYVGCATFIFLSIFVVQMFVTKQWVWPDFQHGERKHNEDDICPDRLQTDFWHTFFSLSFIWFYLLQSTEVGHVIWRIGLCTATDPGHLLRRSLTGQCVKFYNNIFIFRWLKVSKSKACMHRKSYSLQQPLNLQWVQVSVKELSFVKQHYIMLAWPWLALHVNDSYVLNFISFYIWSQNEMCDGYTKILSSRRNSFYSPSVSLLQAYSPYYPHLGCIIQQATHRWEFLN